MLIDSSAATVAMIVQRGFVVVSLLVCVVTALDIEPEPGIDWPPPEDKEPIRLYDDYGNLTLSLVKTCPKRVQMYFDQGFRFIAAFDIRRAVRSFRAAQHAAGGGDHCPLCVWGEALALGPNLNAFDEPRTLGSVPLAFERASAAYNLQRSPAQSASCAAVDDGIHGELSGRDLALTAALKLRFAATAAEFVAHAPKLRAAYAAAMDSIADAHPADANLLTLAAEGWMNTNPWDYWLSPTKARPEAERALKLLEKALHQDPSHGFAVHLYVHITEASGNPAAALRYAMILPQLFPGSPHNVHMAFHTLMHTGGYKLSEQVNLDATKMPRQVYPMHNLDTLAWVCRMEGRSACAEDAALRLEKLTLYWSYEPNMFETGFPISRFAVQYLLTLVAFGRDSDILQTKAPPASADDYWQAIWHFARGVAAARISSIDKSEIELKALQAYQRQIKAGALRGGVASGMPAWAFGNFGGNQTWGAMPVLEVLSIAEAELKAHLALAKGNKASAIAHWRSAAAAELDLDYDEPPTWYLPVAGRLGAALLADGSVDDAQEVYATALKQYPHDGWLLFGALQVCQKRADMQATTAAESECEAERMQFSHAWRSADVKLASSAVVADGMAAPQTLYSGISHMEVNSGLPLLVGPMVFAISIAVLGILLAGRLLGGRLYRPVNECEEPIYYRCYCWDSA